MAAIDIYTNEAIAAVIPNSETILSIPYLYFLLQSIDLGQYARQAVKGNTVTKAILLAAPIPLPPLPVQERIVAILEKADEVRRKRQEALQIADQILPALFIEMFGDPTTNPKGWDTHRIARITSLVTSGYTPRGGAANYLPQGPLLLRSTNVHMLRLDLSDCAHIPEDIFAQMNRVHVQVGDVLLNITGKGTAGRVTWVAVPNLRAAVNQHVCIIRCDTSHLTPPFLAFLLSTPRYQALFDRAPGSTRSGISHSAIRALEIPVPPLSEQQRFAEYATAFESVRAKLQASLCDAESAFNVLLQRAFTGELTAEWEARNADWIAQRQAFCERLPQLVLLAFLHEKAQQARKAGVLITALMKYAFLLQMEGASRRRLYNFVPYHYGPFAQEVYSDLENLQQQGLVIIEEDDEKTRINLTAPDKAEQALLELPEDLRQDVAAIVETYGNLDHEGLLKVVYERYPAYAKKSRRRSAGKRR